MKALFVKNKVVAIATIVIGISLCAASMLFCKSSVAVDDHPGEKDIVLNASILLNAKTTTLLFTLSNKSDADFTTNDFYTNDNYLEIVTPDGKIKCFSNARLMPKQIVVQKKSDYVWHYDVKTEFDYMKFTDKGTYKITWKIGKLEANIMYVTIE